MRFHFHEPMGLRLRITVAIVLIRIKTRYCCAFNNTCVIGIRNQRTLRTLPVCIANHGKQRLIHRLTVDDPAGIEDFVAAVLGISLREHHQLNIRGITPGLLVMMRQIFYFVRR